MIQLRANFLIAGLKFFLHRIQQVLNYQLSQEPEFSRYFLVKQLRSNQPTIRFQSHFGSASFSFKSYFIFSKTHDACYSIEGARNTDRDRCDIGFNQNMKMICKYTNHGVPDASCAAMNFLIYDKCKDFCSIGWYNSVATCSLR